LQPQERERKAWEKKIIELEREIQKTPGGGYTGGDINDGEVCRAERSSGLGKRLLRRELNTTAAGDVTGSDLRGVNTYGLPS